MEPTQTEQLLTEFRAIVRRRFRAEESTKEMMKLLPVNLRDANMHHLADRVEATLNEMEESTLSFKSFASMHPELVAGAVLEIHALRTMGEL